MPLRYKVGLPSDQIHRTRRLRVSMKFAFGD
jgi:hypothetical protein